MKYSVHCSAHSGGRAKDCNEKLAILDLDAGVKLQNAQGGDKIDGYLCPKCAEREWKVMLPFISFAMQIMDQDEAARIAALRQHFLVTGNKRGLENLAKICQEAYLSQRSI